MDSEKDLKVTPDSSPTHLINHPSYQEMGDNKRRTRTRRSRIGMNGVNGKDESRLGNPLTFVNEADLDLDDGELTHVPEMPSLLFLRRDGLANLPLKMDEMGCEHLLWANLVGMREQNVPKLK